MGAPYTDVRCIRHWSITPWTGLTLPPWPLRISTRLIPCLTRLSTASNSTASQLPGFADMVPGKYMWCSAMPIDIGTTTATFGYSASAARSAT